MLCSFAFASWVCLCKKEKGYYFSFVAQLSAFLTRQFNCFVEKSAGVERVAVYFGGCHVQGTKRHVSWREEEEEEAVEEEEEEVKEQRKF